MAASMYPHHLQIPSLIVLLGREVVDAHEQEGLSYLASEIGSSFA